MKKINCILPFLLHFLICSVIIGFMTVSCTSRNMIGRYQPLLGSWRTERNIIMSIHNTPDHDVAAVIKTAPGYLGDETKPGRVIISSIKPLVDGGFTGVFLMPGNLNPVKIKLVFENRDTLIIMSWDKRAQGRIQKWTRVRRQD